jgi:hypothetical protein
MFRCSPNLPEGGDAKRPEEPETPVVGVKESGADDCNAYESPDCCLATIDNVVDE